MKKTAIIISTCSILMALVFNELNCRHLISDGFSLCDNQTVFTADDISYLRPALNLIEKGEFRDNNWSNGAYLVRSPGYSLILSMLGFIFGSSNLLQVAKIFQLFLFGASVYILFIISLELLKSKIYSVIIAAFYGVSGIAFGFVYYTLTESITPFMVLVYALLLIKGNCATKLRRKRLFYMLASLSMAFIVFTRPVLAILGLALPIFIYRDFRNNFKNTVYTIIISGAIAFSLTLFWQIRNYSKTGQIVGLHPIYYNENSNSCFRPAHEALWEFCKSWGENGAKFHGYTVPFWSNIINGTYSEYDANNIISSWPSYVVNYFGDSVLRDVVNDYKMTVEFQKYYYENK